MLAVPLAAAGASQAVYKHDTLAIETAKGRQTFSIEIADYPEALQQGLMHRKHMPANHGMLFLFERELPVLMWMKDTPMPLDMLFIDSTGRIVYIAPNATPYSTRQIGARKPVRAVLELKGGTAGLRGITAGDRVIYPSFRP
jgi:uncharacterized membrane protein (UPF0127 family)